MEWLASVRITLRRGILDPQGKAVEGALRRLGFREIEKVSCGKYMEIYLQAETEADARQIATSACQKLLANPVMEDFEVQVSPLGSGAWSGARAGCGAQAGSGSL